MHAGTCLSCTARCVWSTSPVCCSADQKNGRRSKSGKSGAMGRTQGCGRSTRATRKPKVNGQLANRQTKQRRAIRQCVLVSLDDNTQCVHGPSHYSCVSKRDSTTPPHATRARGKDIMPTANRKQERIKLCAHAQQKKERKERKSATQSYQTMCAGQS